MRVLGLCSYPIEAAATRFRMAQFVDPLRERGIELTIRPFLDSRQFRDLYKDTGIVRKAAGMVGPLGRRIAGLADIRSYDLIFVQREAMFFGPGIFEWICQKAGSLPIVLDLDDATYLSYISPSYGRIGSFFKFFGKTDKLIKRSTAVVCGNRFIAGHVESLGKKAVIVPTVVDTDFFSPVEKNNEIPVIGWIGTHSTFAVLRSFFPVLQRLAQKHRFIFRIVGGGVNKIEIDGVEVQNLAWSLDREISDFQSLDIGLYPITTTSSMPADWILAKSGFKAIQYLAVGIPFVMSPVGGCAEIADAGKTHFNAETEEDWYNSLETLLSNPELRIEMGKAGRRYSLENYSLPRQVNKLAAVFRQSVEDSL
jgi:glycosyltransferase involved in cell wall biosynthesis